MLTVSIRQDMLVLAVAAVQLLKPKSEERKPSANHGHAHSHVYGTLHLNMLRVEMVQIPGNMVKEWQDPLGGVLNMSSTSFLEPLR